MVSDNGIHCGETGPISLQDAVNRLNCYAAQGYRAFIVNEFGEVVK